ncbi:EF-hand domain-containing protein [Plasmodiophora brassicae]|uniref:EF-hand domain-containing protein n=1 Tax=Plasmodiophora brassicae TaxID=37360 RepID=A0A3P3YIP6_PLABS|nr:unnamed protein product [Plasmodiophora brassicae]
MLGRLRARRAAARRAPPPIEDRGESDNDSEFRDESGGADDSDDSSVENRPRRRTSRGGSASARRASSGSAAPDSQSPSQPAKDDTEAVSQKPVRKKRKTPTKKKGGKHEALTWQQLQDAFRLIDTDSKGLLTQSDLQRAMSELGGDPLADEDARAMLMEADNRGDRNGRVSMPDFMEMMRVAFPEVLPTDGGHAPTSLA